MDWRSLGRHGRDRGPEFYREALEYGHFLWRHGRPARAILCLDRAFGADMQADDSVLKRWPLPYAALAWFLVHAPRDRLVGNPRVHFQHYAGRMNKPRREQRRWRAWACWALTRRLLPHLPADPKHRVTEPTEELIATRLATHGMAGEAEWWRAGLSDLPTPAR